MGVAAVGSEILVNTATAGAQEQAQVVVLSGGGFVVTWTDGSQGVGGATGDASSTAIKAQVFTAGGTPLGAEIRVNTATDSAQGEPHITGLSNGGFAIAWSDASQSGGDTSANAVRAQVFDASGAPVGTEVLVNTATAGDQFARQITALSGGGFVVAWSDASATGGDASGLAVRAQVFGTGGTPVGGEILVNTATAGAQSEPQMTALAGGGFVVTWSDASATGGDTSGLAVRAQVFGATGAPVGTEILVNTITTGNQQTQQVTALANGGFAVTWRDDSASSGDTSGTAVMARVFEASGAPMAAGLLVNATTAGLQTVPQITALANGGFVVAWQDTSQSGGDTSGAAVRAQVFGAAGTPVGAEILVNTTTAGGQTAPEITALANGGFVVTWQDASHAGGDASASAVRAQAFGATGTRVGNEILVNTTTANDQLSAHGAALPDGFVVIWRDLSQSGGDTSLRAVRAQVFALTNDAPAGADAALGAVEGSPRVLAAADFGFSDSNGDHLAAVRIATLPATGTLTNDGAPVTAGQSVSVADIAAGKLVFIAASAGAASFTFQVRDDGGVALGGVDLDATPNTLTLNVAAAPPAPPAPEPTPTAGSAGNDVATLDPGPDSFAAGAGNDWVSAGDGGDTIQGNMGADTLYGDGGNDLVYGGKDDDLVDGGLGDDRLYGDLGNDTVVGGNGADALEGGDGDDRLDGGFGADVLQGGAGADRVEGGEGADTVRGGQASDVVLGGAGNDWLSGDRGDDTLTGGAGADVFHSFSGAGLDRITDFSRAEGDRIQLDPGTTYSVAQAGADTVVTLGGGGQVVLVGVQANSLTGDWLFGA